VDMDGHNRRAGVDNDENGDIVTELMADEMRGVRVRND